MLTLLLPSLLRKALYFALKCFGDVETRPNYIPQVQPVKCLLSQAHSGLAQNSEILSNGLKATIPSDLLETSLVRWFCMVLLVLVFFACLSGSKM